MPPAYPHPRTILCILAGGRSSRFGSSKLAIHIDGEPVLAWQARRLAGALPGRVLSWLSVAPGRPLPAGAGAFSRHIADPEPFGGPLTGIAAVLAAARPHDRVAFVPADMLLLKPRHLGLFFRAMRGRRDCAAVMAAWGNGPRAGCPEPLPSLWRAGPGLRLLRLAAKEGVRGPSQLIDWPGVACITLDWPRHEAPWSSVNRRGDLKKVAAALPGKWVEVPRDE